MDSGKRPKLIHLVIALESVVLLALLVMLTPWGSRLTLSGRAGIEKENGEDGFGGDTDSTKDRADGSRQQDGRGSGAGAEDGRGLTGAESAADGGSGSVAGAEDGRGQSGAGSTADGGPGSGSGAGAEDGLGLSGRDGDGTSIQEDPARQVDFSVTSEALRKAFRYDINTCQSEIHLDWIEILAYLGARYGGDFSCYQEADIDAAAQRLNAGEKMSDIAAGMEDYPYYLELYTAVLGGMVGEFQIEIPGSQAPDFVLPKDEDGNPIRTDDPVWVTKYGLKAFSPIAKNYPYTDYDDFGAARDYAPRNVHTGHDLMGQAGTPVIAVESGYVETMGWDQYGGWQLGIRSLDGRRYYYYAHLRRNYPYHKTLKMGSTVQAGDVIGYLGRTGGSTTKNTNNIDTPHLHFGIQLILGESPKDSDNEVWIDCYELIKFLSNNQSETIRDQETKEYYRVYQMKDPAIPGGAADQRIGE